MKLKFLFIVSIFVLVFSACHKLAPAGFWNDFEKKFLRKNISDQGPNGGHRAMHWNSDKENYFNPKTIIDFAKRNGWQFVDSVSIPVDTVSTWLNNGMQIFPLNSEGFSPNVKCDPEFDFFPRWINSTIILLKFKTGWTTIEPGTDETTEVNGFVVISGDGKSMSVYHLWGE